MKFMFLFSVVLVFFDIAGTKADSLPDLELDLRYIGLPNKVMTNGKIEPFTAEFLKHVEYAHLEIDLLYESLKSASPKIGLSAACLGDVTFLAAKLQTNDSLTTLQYIDAASKIPYGILAGKFNWEGDYQECTSILKTKNPMTNTEFMGKYFTGEIFSHGKPVFQNKYPILYGFCLPDSCNTTDAQVLLSVLVDKVVSYIRNTSKLIPDPKLQVVAVVTDKEKEYGTGVIITLTISGILITLMFAGTLLDLFCHKDKSQDVKVNNVERNTTDLYEEPTERTGLLTGDIFNDQIQEESMIKKVQQKFSEVVRAFSFYSNVKRLFGTTTAHGPLACLNGIRVLSMWWVILGHNYAFIITFLDNSANIADVLKRFSFQPILNGTFSVDSFFFLSGLLVAYLAFKEILEKGNFSWVYFFVHRYWRLTPLLAYVILFYTNFFPLLLFGPLAIFAEVPGNGLGTDYCKKYWWTDLLYINNFYPHYGNLATQCIGWTWYLANDMQFYVFISPVVIILLKKKKTIGLAFSFGLIAACILIRGALIIYYGIHMGSIGFGAPSKHKDEPMAIAGPLYGRPYARMSVYVIGMLVGYLLAVQKCRVRIHRLMAVTGWVVAIAVGLAVVYGEYSYNKNLVPPTDDMVASVFYNSLCRTLWGACLAWVVLACVAGYGGPVNEFLSWSFWAPLGRLTYSAYLVHPVLIFWVYLSQFKPLYFTDLSLIYYFIGNLVLSYAIGFLFSMAVEAPMIQLEKILLKIKLPVTNYRLLRN